MKPRHMKQSDPEEYIASAKSAFSRKGNLIASILFAILCLLFFLPVLLILIVSFSSESSVAQIGYIFSRSPYHWRPGATCCIRGIILSGPSLILF